MFQHFHRQGRGCPGQADHGVGHIEGEGHLPTAGEGGGGWMAMSGTCWYLLVVVLIGRLGVRVGCGVVMGHLPTAGKGEGVMGGNNHERDSSEGDG